MGQVPASTSFLLLGDGRMARHVAHYLRLLKLPFETWKRADGPLALEASAEPTTHVLVLVSDDSIESVLKAFPFLSKRVCVHFSGAVTTPLAVGAHPLMTFSQTLYSLDEYRRIPFVIERGTEMRDILPCLPNPSFEIDPEDKPLYHALCAMAGNYTVLLWEKVFAEFESELGFPKTALIPYLERIAKNLAESKSSVLTGPLARGDRETIEKHLHALGGDPYADVYRAFVSAYGRTQGGHA
jgi:2-dehydropantoate 2-reductase